MQKSNIQVCFFVNCILQIILYISISTNNLAYTNMHPPYIQYHTNISPCCGQGSRAFVEEQSMVSSQSLSTMDAATAEPIWTLEQGGFPDEALKRGRACLSGFFLQKSSFVGKKLATVRF